MTEISNLENKELLSEKVYWEQLDLLCEAYKVKEHQEKLKKKLKELQKELNKTISNQNIQRLKALQILVKELAQKKEQVYSVILDSFNIYKIREEVSQLRGYLTELNKALKKKKIDVNTYRITHDHYNKQLNFYLKNLDRLKLLAKEYILRLKNEEIELNADVSFKKGKKLIKNSGYNTANYKNIKNVINQKINFLNTKIINN